MTNLSKVHCYLLKRKRIFHSLFKNIIKLIFYGGIICRRRSFRHTRSYMLSLDTALITITQLSVFFFRNILLRAAGLFAEYNKFLLSSLSAFLLSLFLPLSTFFLPRLNECEGEGVSHLRRCFRSESRRTVIARHGRNEFQMRFRCFVPVVGYRV